MKPSSRCNLITWVILGSLLLLLSGCGAGSPKTPSQSNNNAGVVVAAKSPIDFGTVPVGSSKSLQNSITNNGPSAVTISQADVSGAGFSVSGLTPPITLEVNHSVTFTMTFAPKSGGAVNGTVTFASDANNSPLNIDLSGAGGSQGQLSVSPATLNFGNVVDGTSSSLNGTLSASAATVTISSASINSSEFVLSGLSFPLNLAAGQSTSFKVTFTPTSSGTANANLVFSSNAGNSPTTEALTGNGTPPPQHSVDLTWNGSQGAVGYNVYRGTTNGGPYSKINGVLDSSSSYTDTNILGGQTYYYVVTAVDSQQDESGYSNQVKAVIPSP